MKVCLFLKLKNVFLSARRLDSNLDCQLPHDVRAPTQISTTSLQFPMTTICNPSEQVEASVQTVALSQTETQCSLNHAPKFTQLS